VLYAFNAPPLTYTAYVNVTLAPTPGVLAYLKPQLSPSNASVTFGFPSIGSFEPNVNSPPPGMFAYPAGQAGQERISYQVFQTGTTNSSNPSTITINIVPGPKLLPSTPFFNSLRKRWSIGPDRFSFYHPRLGSLIGLEFGGIPAKPTTIVSANKHFDVTEARSSHAKSPRQYDQEHPFLGAIFQLETPGSNHVSLLPQTAFFNEQLSLYDNHPTPYQVKHVYLGAIFAIENLEQSGTTALPPTPAQAHRSP